MRSCSCGAKIWPNNKSGNCRRCANRLYLREHKYYYPEYQKEYHKRTYVPRPKKPSLRKVIKNLRKRTKQVLFVKNFHFSELLGCGTAQLRSHLESQFTPEMSWGNYGSYWVIDHIKPLSKFGREACHYTNLQPLEKEANRIKGDTYEG